MLNLPFAMRHDRTAQAFRWKLVDRMDITSWSRQNTCAKWSIFRQSGKESEPMSCLGLDPGRVVICARSFSESPFKGFGFFVEVAAWVTLRFRLRS
jgi:hypothetical protein